jgi:hypothetical protein
VLLRGCKRVRERTIVGLLIAATFAVSVPATPASAQGFLEFLFGGLGRRRPPPPPQVHHTPSDLFNSLFDGNRRRDRDRDPESVRSAGGPYSGYCVRLCDGRYFPVQAQRNATTVAQCSAACPASPTKVFAGNAIEHARAGDGQRYNDLPNAFVYRERMVPGCTCNGKSSVGLASTPAAEDPTLRPGDIVATNSGFTVYNGRESSRQGAFTPIDSARVPSSVRNQLADVKVMPRPPSADAAPEVSAQDRTSSIASDRRRLSAR